MNKSEALNQIDVPIWIVTKPTRFSTVADICFQSTIPALQFQFLGGLKSDAIAGVFADTDEAGAVALAEELIAEVKS